MIREIYIENMRSIGSATIKLKEGINRLAGPSGAGKTTVKLALQLFAQEPPMSLINKLTPTHKRFKVGDGTPMVRVTTDVYVVEARILNLKTVTYNLREISSGRTAVLNSYKKEIASMVGMVYTPDNVQPWNLTNAGTQLGLTTSPVYNAEALTPLYTNKEFELRLQEMKEDLKEMTAIKKDVKRWGEQLAKEGLPLNATRNISPDQWKIISGILDEYLSKLATKSLELGVYRMYNMQHTQKLMQNYICTILMVKSANTIHQLLMYMKGLTAIRKMEAGLKECKVITLTNQLYTENNTLQKVNCVKNVMVGVRALQRLTGINLPKVFQVEHLVKEVRVLNELAKGVNLVKSGFILQESGRTVTKVDSLLTLKLYLQKLHTKSKVSGVKKSLLKIHMTTSAIKITEFQKRVNKLQKLRAQILGFGSVIDTLLLKRLILHDKTKLESIQQSLVGSYCPACRQPLTGYNACKGEEV